MATETNPSDISTLTKDQQQNLNEDSALADLDVAPSARPVVPPHLLARLQQHESPDLVTRDNEIRELKEKLEQAEVRRRALEDERRQKVEEHLAKVQLVRDNENSQFEHFKSDLDQKMKAAEERRLQIEAALKEKIQARQAQADQVRLRQQENNASNQE
ncbi:hypothetical protein BG004_002620 [Podila humilis]|nr:hypothetical protein BG004_002620 [Podila humilis]